MFRFAAVAADSVAEGERGAIVHEARVEAYAPEWGSADFVGGIAEFVQGKLFPGALGHPSTVVLGDGLHDAIARPDVVKQEVAIGMERFITSASGIVNAPPFMAVPVAAVVSVGTWQVAQPILSKTVSPCFASGVCDSVTSRAGASEARMKRAK